MYYDIGKDSAFCHVCLRTEFEKKFHASTKRDAAFITKDFTYWKDATSSFCNHQISGCHKEAIAVIEVLSHQSRDVGELLNAHQQNQKAENREMILRILENVRFLVRQGRYYEVGVPIPEPFSNPGISGLVSHSIPGLMEQFV